MPEPPRDDEVIAAARARDEQAFVVLYRDVQPRLLRYLRVLVGDDAEDVASETWGAVARDLHQFVGDRAAFRAWVATIGRHRALNHLRSAGRRPQAVPLEGLPEWWGRTPSAADVAEDGLATRAALAQIASLPPDQAEAVLLRVVLGLDVATAAAVLGKRPGAVRTAAHRGVRGLARRLGARPDAASDAAAGDRAADAPGRSAERVIRPSRPESGVTPAAPPVLKRLP